MQLENKAQTNKQRPISSPDCNSNGSVLCSRLGISDHATRQDTLCAHAHMHVYVYMRAFTWCTETHAGKRRKLPFCSSDRKLAPVCRWFINRGQCWEENRNSIYWQCHLVLFGLSFLVLFCCVLFPKIPGLNAAFQVEANLIIHDWPATEKLRTNSSLSVLPYGTESLQECVCYG